MKMMYVYEPTEGNARAHLFPHLQPDGTLTRFKDAKAMLEKLYKAFGGLDARNTSIQYSRIGCDRRELLPLLKPRLNQELGLGGRRALLYMKSCVRSHGRPFDLISTRRMGCREYWHTSASRMSFFTICPWLLSPLRVSSSRPVLPSETSIEEALDIDGNFWRRLGDEDGEASASYQGFFHWEPLPQDQITYRRAFENNRHG